MGRLDAYVEPAFSNLNKNMLALIRRIGDRCLRYLTNAKNRFFESPAMELKTNSQLVAVDFNSWG